MLQVLAILMAECGCAKGTLVTTNASCDILQIFSTANMHNCHFNSLSCSAVREGGIL